MSKVVGLLPFVPSGRDAPTSFEPELRKHADWSALRFRRAEFIRSLRRAPERALSAQGRARVART